MKDQQDWELEARRLRSQLNTERFAYWLALGTLIVVLWLSHMGGMLYEVQLDGRAVAWTARDTDAARALQNAQEAWHKELGANVKFPQTSAIEQAKAGGRKEMTLEQAAKLVKAALKPQIAAAAILVNGEARVALSSPTQAQEALDEVKRELLGDERGLVGKPSWKEKIEIGERQLSPDRLESDLATAVDRLLGGKPSGGGALATYSVKSGDNGQTIAQSQGVALSHLKRLNSRVDFTKLQVGQKLVVKRGASTRVGKPLLTLKVTRRRQVEQPVPFETREVVTAAVSRGQRKVATPGKPGRRRVTEETQEENGVVVHRSERITQVIQEPVAAVVLVGQGSAPSKAPTPAKSPAPTTKVSPRRTGRSTDLPSIVRRAPVATRRLPQPAPPLE